MTLTERQALASMSEEERAKELARINLENFQTLLRPESIGEEHE